MLYRLRCSDTGGATFDVAPSTTLTTGFRERCHYLLELRHATPCTLVIDDVSIECVRDDDSHRWAWQPQFFAGTVLAELFDHDGTCLAEYRLDVSPAPDKLGQELFEQILDELLAADPQLLFGAEAAQLAIGVEGSFSSPQLEYGRIKKFVPLLLQSIQKLRARPVTRLRRDRQLAPPHRVRRFDQHSIRTLARDPQALAAMHGTAGSTGTSGRLLLDVPQSREELDNPAHRALLSMLVTVIRRIRRVRAELDRLSATEPATAFRTPLAPRRAYRRALLDNLEQALRRQCRETPFASVRRAEVSAAGLNAIAGHPLYAAAYRQGRRLLRPGIDGRHEGEMLSISPTWEIYERWCFQRLTKTLRLLFPFLSWNRSAGSKFDRLKDTGTADGITVTTYLQKTFPSMDQQSDKGEFYSISRERRPDIVVCCTIAERQRFVVLDPKYSVSRSSVLSAMEAAHIYRDSLRWNGRAPDLALLLIPSAGEARWLEESAFHTAHRVGVLPLSPDSGLEQLRLILQDLLLENGNGYG